MSSNGFTLVEFSVVMTIFALLVGSAIFLYAQYYEKKKLEENITSIESMEDAIKAFFAVEGRFPCPAPLTAGVGDSNYGMELDCQNTVPSPDYRLTTNTIEIDGTNENVRIRIGTFPFRSIFETLADEAIVNPDNSPFLSRLTSDDVLDAYGRQFTYAVTEEQATTGYKDKAGAIEIFDEHGQLIAERKDFILVSHGDDGSGAITKNGTPYAGCNTGTVDEENCDNDPVFVAGLRSETAGPNYYDDTVSQLQYIPFYLWDQTEEGSYNIINENFGNVGINVTDPQERLHVEGNVTAGYFGVGSAFSENLCAENSGIWNADCFSAEVIAGTLDPNHLDPDNDDLDNNDIACPPGSLMKRIIDGGTGSVGSQEGDNDCFQIEYDSANTNCAPNEYVKKFSYDLGTRQITATCVVDNTAPNNPDDNDNEQDSPQDVVSEYSYCQENPDSRWCNEDAESLIEFCNSFWGLFSPACRTN